MVSGTVFSFGALIVGRFATIVNSIIIVRVLGFFNLGILSIVVLTTSVANLFATFGVPASMVKFLAEIPADRPEEASSLLGAGFAITLATTSLTLIALALVSPVLSSLYAAPAVASLLLVASLGVVLNSVPSPISATFQAFELVRQLATRNIASAILSVPATVVLVVLWGLNGAVWAAVLNAGIATFVNITFIRRIWRPRELSLEIPSKSAVYRKVLSYSVPAFVGSVLVTPVLWFANTYLATRSSFAEVGKYSVAFGLANYLLFIPAAIGVPLIPIVSRMGRFKPHEFQPFLTKAIRVSGFLLILPTLVLFAFPEAFLDLLYGAGAAAAAQIVRVLALAVFLAGLSTTVGGGIAGTGRMWEGLLLNLIWGAVLVFMTLILVPGQSGLGLAFSYLIAYMVHFSSILVYIKERWSVDIREVSAPVAIMSAAIGAVVLLNTLVADALRSIMVLGLLIAVVAIERALMTSREIEVLSEPIRRFVRWISQTV